MSTTANKHDYVVTQRGGMSVTYYLPNLSEFELVELHFWSQYCYRNAPIAVKFAAYLDCLFSVERQRRELLDEGNEVLEVSMPELPCHVWSNPEVVAALTKATTLSDMTDGEVQKLMRKLRQILLVEASTRLDPDNIAGQ